MPPSRFKGATVPWFENVLKEYRTLYINGATQPELAAWSDAKWPEFRTKFSKWMQAKDQRDMSINEWREKYRIKFYSYYYRNLLLKNVAVKKPMIKKDDTPPLATRLRHRNSVAASGSATLISEHSCHSESLDEDEKPNEVEDEIALHQAKFPATMKNFLESTMTDGIHSLGDTVAFHLLYTFRKPDDSLENGYISVKSADFAQSFEEFLGDMHEGNFYIPWIYYCKAVLGEDDEFEKEPTNDLGNLFDYETGPKRKKQKRSRVL